MDDRGFINENGGKYAGMDRYEARKQIVEDLKELGLLEKIEDHKHNVGTCQRCATVVEPVISKQWFVKMKPLAEPAIKVVRDGKTKFIPERFAKIYFNWMENIQDWCISRQLWWGHRIPAYYCQKCGEVVVAKEMPEKCAKCGHDKFEQDPDTLDTWFSSALWPFSTLGWPEETEDLKYFYPTDVLVTAYDIIFFWVARMIFSAVEQTNEVPFRHVLIHGLIRDEQGRKMSKSLGNGIDPLEVIDEYGTDALRFTLISGNSPGNDQRYLPQKTIAARNFANKIWNATRFVLLNFDEDVDFSKVDRNKFTVYDKWILSASNNLVKEVTENLNKYELGIALGKVYDFIWDVYCDWYIEIVKPRLFDKENEKRLEAQYVLNEVLVKCMKLLHPFMPFITEEIYQSLIHDSESIMISKWPEFDESHVFAEEEEKVNTVIQAIRSIRNIRAEMNVPPSRKAGIIFVTDESKFALLQDSEPLFNRLASANGIRTTSDRSDVPENSATAVVPGIEIFIPLEELIDFEKEIERLEKELENLKDELDRVNKKLSNENFVKKAPENIVEEERKKKEKYTEMYNNVLERIKILKK
jgi:valyl-tRNA synthetase